MARGLGGKYGMDQGRNPARGQFASTQPVSPVASAPSSPRVGAGTMASVPAGGGASTNLDAGAGDIPLPSMQAAATPTYGAMSIGAVTNSNRIG